MSYKRKRYDRRKLKKLYLLNNYYAGVIYNEDTGSYRRYYRSQVSKYLKNVSNRKVRRRKLENLQHGDYKKVFDYWWELY